MDYIIPISEVRSNLPNIIKKVRKNIKHLIITKNGKAEAVLLSPEELETLEIMADSDLLSSIRKAQEDISGKKLYSHENVFKDV